MAHSRIRYPAVILFVLTHLVSIGQNKSFKLNGRIHVNDGDNFGYQLNLQVEGETLTGYSITKLPDGTHPKIAVTGKIDRKKQQISFRETKVLSEPKDGYSMCLIDAVVNNFQAGSKYLLKGNFTGWDRVHHLCGNGTVEFEQSAGVPGIFARDTVKPLAPSKRALDSIAMEKMSVKKYEQIRVLKEMEWTNDTCVIALWDGGIIDGDVISIRFNNQKVLEKYKLTPGKIELRLPLTRRTNSVSIIAEDEGSLPPNTVDIQLIDGGKKYQFTAHNSKGDSAVILLNRK